MNYIVLALTSAVVLSFLSSNKRIRRQKSMEWHLAVAADFNMDPCTADARFRMVLDDIVQHGFGFV